MLDRLVQAYTPLICWTGLGILVVRFLPKAFPYWLGRGLYWVGVPIEIFSLARQTIFDERARLAPTITICSLLLGLSLGWISLQVWQKLSQQLEPPTSGVKGSLLLSSMLGNTGFVGLAIVPFFVSETDLSWAVLYSVTQNVFGTYGLGVLVSSYYGRQGTGTNRWWTQLKDLLCVPSLWGFALGSQFWGTGLFVEGARAVLNFGVDVLGVLRFEARAAIANGRGNGALRKIGAVQEGVLRRSFLRDGHYHDQVLWSILAEDWRLLRIVQGPARVH